jgi:hypothetical protein
MMVHRTAPKRRVPRPWCQKEIDEIGRLAIEGVESRFIAAQLDRSAEEIEWAAARHGIDLRGHASAE